MFESIQSLGPRQPKHYERQPFAHATAQQQRVSAQDFICARLVVRFGPPKEENGVQHMFFLFLENQNKHTQRTCLMLSLIHI